MIDGIIIGGITVPVFELPVFVFGGGITGTTSFTEVVNFKVVVSLFVQISHLQRSTRY